MPVRSRQNVQKLRGPEAKAVFEQFEQQNNDLLAAMRWFIAQGRTDESLKLVNSLVAFWMATKRLAEGSGWLDHVLALPGEDNVHRGQAFFNAGYLATWMGGDERSAALQYRAVELGRRINNASITALALVGLAAVAKDRGEYERGAALIGIADATLAASGGAWPPDELVHYEQTVAALSKVMGLAEFEQMRAWGSSLTKGEGVNFALRTNLAKPVKSVRHNTRLARTSFAALPSG